MTEQAQNRNLNSARGSKKDEFYTQLSDIEKELRHYTKHFKGKVVVLQLRRSAGQQLLPLLLVQLREAGHEEAHHHLLQESATRICSVGMTRNRPFTSNTTVTRATTTCPTREIGIQNLKGDGDFRSEESIELLQASRYCRHEPTVFSVPRVRSSTCQVRQEVSDYREYERHNLQRDFSARSGITRLWFGPSISSGDREFGVPDHYPLDAAGSRIDDEGKKYIRVKGVRWFTNLDYRKRHEDLILYKTYTAEEYPTYDNYDAIEVGKTKDIPMDYDGTMGVPITFLDKYNPDQFEIIGSFNTRRASGQELGAVQSRGCYQLVIKPILWNGPVVDKQTTLQADRHKAKN